MGQNTQETGCFTPKSERGTDEAKMHNAIISSSTSVIVLPGTGMIFGEGVLYCLPMITYSCKYRGHFW